MQKENQTSINQGRFIRVISKKTVFLSTVFFVTLILGFSRISAEELGENSSLVSEEGQASSLSEGDESQADMNGLSSEEVVLEDDVVIDDKEKENSKDKKKDEPVEELELESLSSQSVSQLDPEADVLGKHIAPQVSAKNGSLNYEYAITLPPGRNDLTPDLSLEYNSSDKSQSSLVGTGWSIRIPYIQRFNKTGVDNLYTDDYFISSIDGELIDQGSGVYTPRVEGGNFLKYEFVNDTWEVTSKDGTVYLFGSTLQARHSDPNDSTKIFSWMVETITDTNGNSIDYTYYKDQGQIYPDSISYSDGLFEVNFNRDTAPVQYASYASGFEVSNAYVIDEIEIFVDGLLARFYEISTTDNIVKEIVVTGYEGVQSVSLPSTDFEYTHENGLTEWDTTLTHEFDPEYNESSQFADVNGDGLLDWIESYKYKHYAPTQEVYLNTGDSWMLSSVWSGFPESEFYFYKDYDSSSTSNVAYHHQIIDMNGDGLADLVYIDKNDGPGVYLNNGNGWDTTKTMTFSISYAPGIRFADVNGDGLPDRIEAYKYKHYTPQQDIYLNTGTGWVHSTEYSNIPEQDFYFFFESSSSSTPDKYYYHKLVDVNNDNLADLVFVDRSDSGVYLNNGNGWDTTITYEFSSGYDEAVQFADVNGDGLMDYVRAYKYKHYAPNQKVFINTGSDWVESTDWTVFPDSEFYFYIDYSSSSKPNKSFPHLVADINGDSVVDLVFVKPGWDSGVYINENDRFAYLEQLSDSRGLVSDVVYAIAQLEDSSNQAPFPIQVVKTVTVDDNNGNSYVTDYDYYGADNYYGGPFDRKFAGFGSVVKTHPDGSVETTKYHQNNGEDGNEPTDSYAKIGKVYEKTIEDSLDNLYLLERTNYEENSLGNDSNSIQMSSVLTQQYDGTTSHVDTAIEYGYDSYGNVLTETQYGEVAGNIDGSFTDTGSDKRIIERTYTNDTTNYIVGLPTNQTLKNNSSTIEAESDFSYDTDGNLLNESNWISGSNYADTTYTYNSYGLPLTMTDALSNTTTYVYDSEDMYPATITNAEGHVTLYTYDYSSGKPKTITEPNGKVTEYTYDGLDRLVEVKGTIANGATQTLKDVSYNTTASPQYSKVTTYTGSESQDVYSYTDGFGKTIQTKSEMDSGWVTLDTVYDGLGRVEEQSLPYETASSSNSSATSVSNLITSFTYDPLGRVLTTTNAKGATSMSYDGFETTITDAEGNIKNLVSDPFQNLVEVVEHNGASEYTTTYEYNTQDLLTKITDNENNVRNITYDGLGRRTLLEDLHASSDGTFGTWTFSYDDMNLVSQVDPKGTITSYTYDDINRVLTEDNNGVSGVEITYSYDTCTYGTGKLCSVVTPDVTTNYTYLKQGFIDTEAKVIDSVTYTTDTDYDRQGKVTKITHPNASYTEYGYNTRGMVDEVKYGGVSLVTTDYGVHGRPETQTHANGAVSTLTYDDNELYELTNKTTLVECTSSGSGVSGSMEGCFEKIQDLTYTYDNVGNITQIVDTSDTDTAKTQTFTYDDLYRLTGTAVTNSANSADYTRSYTYSSIGNITAFDGVSYTYTDSGYSNPHAVTSVGTQTYTYDNNGNLTTDGAWTHTWDYRNRLVSSTDGSTTSTYKYDSNNDRVKLVEGSDTTIYLAPNYEIKNGNVKVSFNLGDILVATDDNGTTNHIHTDHLGGTNITTDTAGVITQTLDYYPYGDTRIDVGTDNETKQYTGYVKDEGTGLHYAGARYYDGVIGRFVSQDPANLRLGVNEKSEFSKIITNPQLLNTYSYAGNNPVMNIDDNGELSTRAALTNSFAIPTTIVLKQIAKYGGEKYNIPVSQRLLTHSLSLNPKDQHAGQNSDVVGIIRDSETYTNSLDTLITNSENGTIDNVKLPLKFKPKDGDVYSAIGKIDLYVSGTQNEAGNWDLSLSGNDPYDYGFDFSDYRADKFGIGANVLSGAQGAEILTPFNTKVDFKEKNYTSNKQRNKNEE